MSNPWIQHVKAYARNNNVSYAEALQLSKSSYKPKGMVGGGKEDDDFTEFFKKNIKKPLRKALDPNFEEKRNIRRQRKELVRERQQKK